MKSNVRRVRAHRLRRYISPRSRGWDPYDHAHPLLSWYFYRRLDVALALGEVAPHHTVVDIGCWMGHLEVSLVRRTTKVVAVDRADEISREPYFASRVAGWNSLEIAQEMLATELPGHRANCVFVRGDVSGLPVRSESVDVVFCLDTLEHVREIEAALGEIERVLKPGAKLVAAFPVEFGLALVLRQMAGVLTGFVREPYDLRHLVRTLLTNRAPVTTERGGMHHAGYDWRSDVQRIADVFDVDTVEFAPFALLRALNPTVFVCARKRGTSQGAAAS